MNDFNGANIVQTRGEHCCSRFQLERFVAGELEQGTSRVVSGHLETCEICRALLATLEAEKAAFRKKVPFDDFYAGLTQRLEAGVAQELEAGVAQELEAGVAQELEAGVAQELATNTVQEVEARLVGGAHASVASPGRWSALEALFRRIADFFRALSTPALAGLAVAALALVIVVPRLGDILPGLEDGAAGVGTSGTRIKAGRIAPGPLEVEVLRRGEVHRLESGSVFLEGDRLQFKINPGSWGYVQVFSLDDQGRLSPFYQGDGGRSLAVVPGREQHLPDAIRLDDFVGLERIFAVFTESPIAFEVIEAAVEGMLQSESLPFNLSHMDVLPIDDTAQVSFLMVKE